MGILGTPTRAMVDSWLFEAAESRPWTCAGGRSGGRLMNYSATILHTNPGPKCSFNERVIYRNAPNDLWTTAATLSPTVHSDMMLLRMMVVGGC